MPTKFYNLDVDTTLGGNSPSDTAVSSQKATKAYVDGKTLDSLSNVTISSPTAGQNLTYDATNQVWKNTSTSATVAWGGITGDITDQTDLSNALGGKQDKLSAGFISAFAGSTAPAGWLVCDGSAVSRTDYADLFTAIGTTYGTGDGSTTFNLPDLSGKLPLYDSGATLGGTTNGKAPNISGRVGPPKGDVQDNSSGAFYLGGTYASGPLAKHSNQQIYTMDASRCSAVYDNNATGITPAGVYTLWCIKY